MRVPFLLKQFVLFSGHGGYLGVLVRRHGVSRGPSWRHFPVVLDCDRYHRWYYVGSVFIGDAGALGDHQGSGSWWPYLDGDDDVDHRWRTMAHG